MKTMNVLFIVAVSSYLSEITMGAHWTYHDIPAWGTHYPQCKGQHQSPIDIKHADAVVDKKLGEFRHALFDVPSQSMLIKNNGHSLQIDLTNGHSINDRSLLPGQFKAAQFHFHWAAPNALGSESNAKGSEHFFNGNQSWGELHIVHYNTKYPDLGTAAKKSDGLAVLGFFITNDYPQDNTAVKRILDPVTARQVNYNTENKTYATSFSLETFLPNNLTVYYRYQGSLTTPGCYESVVWTIFNQPIRISRRQAKVFEEMVFESKRDASDTVRINGNFRPVQDLNDRTVTRSTYCSGAGSFSMPIFHFIVLCATVVGLIIVR
ncbi:carbonic anhydrase 2-like [Clavelina lepadiformis]|uniref:carbonic anhydrase 2-like n=1 Tax=Clavelina lepadiformis TaxID=159417 RepID=UPI0040434593